VCLPTPASQTPSKTPAYASRSQTNHPVPPCFLVQGVCKTGQVWVCGDCWSVAAEEAEADVCGCGGVTEEFTLQSSTEGSRTTAAGGKSEGGGVTGQGGINSTPASITVTTPGSSLTTAVTAISDPATTRESQPGTQQASAAGNSHTMYQPSLGVTSQSSVAPRAQLPQHPGGAASAPQSPFLAPATAPLPPVAVSAQAASAAGPLAHAGAQEREAEAGGVPSATQTLPVPTIAAPLGNGQLLRATPLGLFKLKVREGLGGMCSGQVGTVQDLH
jgi:hypothetical protein